MKNCYEELLNKVFKIDKLKDQQKQIIELILENKNVIGILPTGFGKSICFQLPALILDGLTIVISPLIALMQDQVISLKKKNIEACYINSSLTKQEINKIYSELIDGKYKLIYVAGERLLNNEFLNVISKVNISLITVDEAHTLLWGDTFRYSLNNIYDFIESINKNIPILALTATAGYDTLKKIKKTLRIEDATIVKASLDRSNIFYRTLLCKNKKEFIFKYIKDNSSSLGIIYCLTVKECEILYNYFSKLGIKIGIYHGRLETAKKNEAINSFLNDELQVMVCSSAFGMGIDKPNVRYVINYNIPLSIEELAQELGRCGRDGCKAESIVLFDPKDINKCNYFIEQMNNNNLSLKENYFLKIKAYKSLEHVIDYATTRGCLHKFMLKQFGQILNTKCNNCSNCKK